MKELSFANREVFSDVDFNDFSKLMFETGMGRPQVSTQEANDKIREVFYQVCGLSEGATRKEIHKAIRRHKNDIFEVIEDTLDTLIIGGWGENPFFYEFVETKYANEGDTNIFTTWDDMILTVSETSGGHHDLNTNRIRVA